MTLETTLASETTPASETVPTSRRAVLLVGVVALVTLAVGALVAIGGPTDSGVTLPEAAPFSLAAAAESTVSARTVEFDLTVTTDTYGSLSVSGAVDNETEVASISTNLANLVGLGEESPFGDAGVIDVLVDGDAGVMYLGAEALGGLLPSDAPWLSVDLTALAEHEGASLEDLQNEWFVDPTDSARLLLDADNVVEIGPETIDGVDTVHYQVTVDVADALAASPQAGSALGDAMIDVPDTVVYDVWVTADNQLRRAGFELAVAGETVSVVLDMTTTDEPLVAELPSESDVFDITGFLTW
jgi:hypothetical protein